MTGTLHMGHDHKSDEMTYMKAVRRRIKANIVCDLFLSNNSLISSSWDNCLR